MIHCMSGIMTCEARKYVLYRISRYILYMTDAPTDFFVLRDSCAAAAAAVSSCESLFEEYVDSLALAEIFSFRFTSATASCFLCFGTLFSLHLAGLI